MKQGTTTVPVVKETVDNGFGDNTVAWRPSGIPETAPLADTTYTVTISGISGAPFSQKIYDVTLIDPYDLNDEVTVTGSATPSSGSANSYSFNAIGNAEGYDALIGVYAASAFTEGAETSPAPQVIDHTDGSYTHIGTSSKASGSRAFHLATPDFNLLDNIEIDRDLIPESGSQISFKYRRLFMHADTKLRVQISGDGGQSFTTIHTISGNNTGSSSQWDPSGFLSASVNVPTGYHNRLARFRFMIETTGSTFVGSDDNNGIYLDDITVSNSLEVTGSTVIPLAAGASSFEYTPATPGEMRVLMVNPQLGGRSWGYGPALKVTSVLGGPPLLTTNPADDATGIAIDSNLTLVFGETVQKGASGTITVHRSGDDSVVGAISVSAPEVVVAGDTVTVDPPFSLDYETEVYVLISAGAFKNSGMAGFAGISSKTEWSFTTELDPSPTFRRWIDQFPGLDPGGLTLEELERLDGDLDGLTLLEEFGFDGDPENAGCSNRAANPREHRRRSAPALLSCDR